MQRTHTAHGVDLAAVARGCGFAAADTVQTPAELDALERSLYTGPGPRFAAIKVAPEPTKIELAPRDGPYLRSRFREALLGKSACL
jgi:thiamine pyrophosphate-dependent acetolactate synthase large subunit-like protein